MLPGCFSKVCTAFGEGKAEPQRYEPTPLPRLQRGNAQGWSHAGADGLVGWGPPSMESRQSGERGGCVPCSGCAPSASGSVPCSLEHPTRPK